MDRNVICIRQSVCGSEYTKDKIKGVSRLHKRPTVSRVVKKLKEDFALWLNSVHSILFA
jgi:hypothetical protein